MTKTINLSFIIPCYRSEHTILSVVEEIESDIPYIFEEKQQLQEQLNLNVLEKIVNKLVAIQ